MKETLIYKFCTCDDNKAQLDMYVKRDVKETEQRHEMLKIIG